jgi:hypothetical protein
MSAATVWKPMPRSAIALSSLTAHNFSKSATAINTRALVTQPDEPVSREWQCD